MSEALLGRRACTVIVVNRTNETWRLCSSSSSSSPSSQQSSSNGPKSPFASAFKPNNLVHGRWAPLPFASMPKNSKKAPALGLTKKLLNSSSNSNSNSVTLDESFFLNWHPGHSESQDALALENARFNLSLPPEAILPSHFVLFATAAKSILTGVEGDLRFEAGTRMGPSGLPSARNSDPPLIRLKWATPKIGAPRAETDVECGHYRVGFQVFQPSSLPQPVAGKDTISKDSVTKHTPRPRSDDRVFKGAALAPRVLFTIYDPSDRRSYAGIESSGDDGEDQGVVSNHQQQGPPDFADDDSDDGYGGAPGDMLRHSVSLTSSLALALDDVLPLGDTAVLSGMGPTDFLREATGLICLVRDLLPPSNARRKQFSRDESVLFIDSVTKLTQFVQFCTEQQRHVKDQSPVASDEELPPLQFEIVLEFLSKIVTKGVKLLVDQQWDLDIIDRDSEGASASSEGAENDKGAVATATTTVTATATCEYDCVQSFLRRSLQLVSAILQNNLKPNRYKAMPDVFRTCGEILNEIFDVRSDCYDLDEDSYFSGRTSKRNKKKRAIPLMPGSGRFAANPPKSERRGYFTLAPSDLLFNINAFGACNGFDAICDALHNLADALKQSSIQAPDFETASASDIDSIIRPIAVHARPYLRGDAGPGEKGSAARGFGVEWVLKLKDAVTDVVEAIPEQGFRTRGNSPDNLARLSTVLEELLTCMLGPDQASGALQAFRLKMLARALHSDLLNRRVDAITELNRILRIASSRPVDRPNWAGGGSYQTTYRQQQIAQQQRRTESKIEPSLLHDWLRDEKIVELALLGEKRLHPEVVRRCNDLFSFLIATNGLKLPHLDALWNAASSTGDTQLRGCVYDLLRAIAPELSHYGGVYVIQKLRKDVNISEVTADDLDLVYELGKAMLTCGIDTSRSKKRQKKQLTERYEGLNFLWSVIDIDAYATLDQSDRHRVVNAAMMESATRKVSRLVHMVDDDPAFLENYIARAAQIIGGQPNDSSVMPAWQSADLCIHLLNNLLAKYASQSKLRSQAQVIEELEKEHSLLEMLARDLQVLAQRTLAWMAVSVSDFEDDATWTPHVQLTRRLNLLRLVLANSSLLLQTSHANVLWDAFICLCGPAEIKSSRARSEVSISDSVFTFFSDVCEEELIVEQAMVAHIFGKFSARSNSKAVLPAELLSVAAFKCFSSFFQIFNSQSGILRPSTGVVSDITKLAGLPVCWRFALKTSFPLVIETAVNFALVLYGGMAAQPTARDELRKQDLHMLHNRLQQCIAGDNAKPDLAGRLVDVLQKILEADDEVLDSDVDRGRSNEEETDKVEGSDTTTKSGITLQVLPLAYASPDAHMQSFFVRCRLVESVGSVRARIALRVHDMVHARAKAQDGRAPKFDPGSLHLFASERELLDDDAQLSTLHIQDQQIIQYQVSTDKTSSKRARFRAVFEGDSDEGPPASASSLFVSLPKAYDVLFSCVTNASLNNSYATVVDSCWNLLMLLPTHAGTVQRVVGLALDNECSCAADWTERLFDVRRHRLILQYDLQVTEPLAAHHSDWRSKFVATGGLSAALSLLNSILSPNMPFDQPTANTAALLVRILAQVSSAAADSDIAVLAADLLRVVSLSLSSVSRSSDDALSSSSLRSLLSGAMKLFVRLVVRSPGTILSVLYEVKDPTCEELLVLGVLTCSSVACREEFVAGIVELCLLPDSGSAKHPRFVIRPFLRKLLARVHEHPDNCAEFFSCMTNLIEADAEAEQLGNDASGVLPPLLERVVESVEQHAVVEWHDRGPEDKVLIGCMELVQVFLLHFPDLRRLLVQRGRGFVTVVFESLFDLDEEGALGRGSVPPPTCKTSASRDMAFKLLETLTAGCAPAVEQLCRCVVEHHCDNEAVQRVLSGRNNWNVEVSREERSAAGYVGLRNLGSTCYMNSVLQQLFMIPKFRKGILRYEPSNLGDSSVRSEEKRRNKKHNKKTPTAAVSDGDEAGTVEPADPVEHPSDVRKPLCADVPPGKDDNEDVIIQLQRVFAWLQESNREAYDTTTFARSYKDWDGRPVDTRQQQDADEFFAQLCDKLETGFSGTLQAPLLRNCWGGTQSTEIVCKGCPHRSESRQSSFTVSLDVQGNASIYDALAAYVKGDVLEGANAYKCEPCGVPRDAVKRTLLRDLPDTLIIHLKRFEFDLTTMRKKKVNDCCEFPIDKPLDIWPYTLAYARRKEGLVPSSGKDDQSVDASSDSLSTSGEPPIELTDTDDAVLRMKREDCLYRLRGIVIHSGGAEGGHYYSFIRAPGSERANASESDWIEFNDRIVRKFSGKDIPRECFGGIEVITRRAAWNRQVWTETVQRSRSAYLLIYERIAYSYPLPAPSPSTSPELSASGPDPSDVPLYAPSNQGSFAAALFAKNLLGRVRAKAKLSGPLVITAPRWLSSTVRDDNSRFLRQKHLFDPSYANFVADVVNAGVVSHSSTVASTDSPKSVRGSLQLLAQALRVGVLFLFRVAGRSTDRRFVDRFSSRLQDALASNIDASRWFCCYFAGVSFAGIASYDDRSLPLLCEVLLECPVAEVRIRASDLCVAAIKNLLVEDERTAVIPPEEEPVAWAGRSADERAAAPLIRNATEVKESCPSLALVDALLSAVVGGAPWTHYTEAFQVFFHVAKTGAISRKFMAERDWLERLLPMLASTRKRHCTRTSMLMFVKTIWIILTNARLPRDAHGTQVDAFALWQNKGGAKYPPTQRTRTWISLPNGGAEAIELLLSDAVLDRLVLRGLDTEKVGQMLVHVAWEHWSRSERIIAYLVTALDICDEDELLFARVAVHDILTISDGLQRERVSLFLTAFLAMLKEKKDDPTERNITYKLLTMLDDHKTHISPVKAWLKKNRSHWDWVSKWSDDNKPRAAYNTGRSAYHAYGY